MYLSMSQELSRQHREDVMHEVATARLGKAARANRDVTFRLVRNLRWELSRCAGLLGKRLRKQLTK